MQASGGLTIISCERVLIAFKDTVGTFYDCLPTCLVLIVLQVRSNIPMSPPGV